MNDKDLKNTINNIRLPEESKERMIRNLEKMTPEEYVFDVEPAKTPVLRYAMTAIAACAVLAVTAAGVYMVNRGGFEPASEVKQSEVITYDEMKALAPEMFSHLAEIPLYAVMGADAENAPDSVTYMTLRDDQKQKLAELYSSLDLENASQWSYVRDETDTFRLFFQYQGIYYSICTAKGNPAPSDGIRWGESAGYVHLTCWTGASEGYTATFQADTSVIDEMMNIIATSSMTHTVPMKYELYSTVYNPTPLMDLMFCETVHTDIINLIAEMDSGGHEACFMTMNPDDISNDARRSGTYFDMIYEQQKEFSNLLMNQNNVSNLHAQYGAGGKIPAVVYLNNGTILEFWSNCILIVNPPSFPDNTFRLSVDESVIEQFCSLLEGFKADSARHEINHINNQTLLEQMFEKPDLNTIIAQAQETFCHLEQAEYYFCIQDSGYLFDNHYESQYFSISEEKQAELAELFAGLPYSDMKENYQSGGYNFVMYLKDKNQQKSLVTILFYDDFDCAYLTWHPDGIVAHDNYYLELDLDTLNQIAEIISEPDRLYPKESKLFEFDDAMFAENIAPFGDISQMETRFMFTDYAPAVILPTDEQKSQIADLLNHFDYGNRVNRNFGYGQYYSMYLNDGTDDEWKQIKFLLEGYISWEEDDKAYIYEAPELVSEIENLLTPVTVVYEGDENGELHAVYLDDYKDYNLSAYLEILEEYNQAHPNYQLRISDNVLNGEPYAVKEFVSRTPEEFRQTLLESYEEDKKSRPGYQLENEKILMHYEGFSPNDDGTFSLDYDETYNLTQEQKQQLADLLNNEVFDYILMGYREIHHDAFYTKSVVEFTEENAWLTVEYDSEEQEYYLIWCQQMEVPGEPVETGTYMFYKVEPRFAADFANAVTPENGLKIDYSVNENGQTYGAVGMLAAGEAYPDLISVIGDNDIQGYCLKSDMDAVDDLYTPESPDKIDEWKATLPDKPPVLNVYAKDGKTIVDTFTYVSE